jgi:hypothetical protein
MLELPGQFLLKTVLGIRQARPDFEPPKLLKWLRVAILARERRELTEGLVLPGHTGIVWNGLDISMIDAQLQEGKEDHAKRLQTARDTRAPDLTPQEWAAGMLRFVKEEPTEDRCNRLADAAKAAYTLDCALWNLARTSSYDFAQHDSDWIDRQQLDYLSDPRMVMITNERRLPARIVGSGQEDRVVRLDTLREAARSGEHRVVEQGVAADERAGNTERARS